MLVHLDPVWVKFKGQGRTSKYAVTRELETSNSQPKICSRLKMLLKRKKKRRTISLLISSQERKFGTQNI